MKRSYPVLLVVLMILNFRTSLAQTVFICTNTSTVITAPPATGLSAPVYSLSPDSVVSSSPNFTVTPPSSVIYTLYTVGTNSNSVVVTYSSTVTFSVSGVSYSVVSPQNFTLGCATKSVCNLNIVNAATFPQPGGPVSYSLVPPGASTVLASGNLTSQSIYSLNTAGLWWVVCRDNNNLCATWTPVSVVQNTAVPSLNSLSVPTLVLNCTTPSVVIKNNPQLGVQNTWLPMNVTADSINLSINYAAPSPSILNTLILQSRNTNNLCSHDTVITFYQNIYRPVASISKGITSPCPSTVVITNTSYSGIPPAVFSTSLPVVAQLWQGPAPQASAALTSTYLAQVSGLYTLTVTDLNNGCTSMDTTTVKIGPMAAFLHTVSGGVATFSSMSSGTGTGTNFFWDFGDGNTSTLQNPTHIYVSGGSHLVKFKVSDAISVCSDSVLQSITVSGLPCVANSGFSLVPTSIPQTWNAIPAYPWNVTAAVWEWGDNSSSSTLYTSHQYSAAGFYNICLSVTVSCAATSSSCATYSVYRLTQEAMVLQVNVVAPEKISGLQPQNPEGLVWDIFPNPNNGVFSIVIETAIRNPVRILVTDLSGRLISDTGLQDTTRTIALSEYDLPAGLYLVTLQSNGRQQTRRLSILR